MSRLRYAIVGCGRRGSAHLAVASKLTDYYEIAAVCDAHPPSAQAAGEKYGVTAYTDLHELVARESIDVCDVVVPIELHHAVSCYLSEQGIHQNVETPIAPTLALADMMIEAAAKNGVKLQISENFPAIPVERMVQTIIQSGAIGQVGRCYRLFSTGGYHAMAAIRMRMGAIPTAVSSCHHVMPVVPYVDRLGRDWREEGFEFALIDFDNGGLGVMMVGNKNGCLGRNHLVGFETVGARGSIITNGNQGTIGGELVYVATDEDIEHNQARARAFPFQRAEMMREEVKVLQRIWVDLPEGTVEWSNPFAPLAVVEGQVSLTAMLVGIATAVRDKVEPLWSGEAGRTDQEMILAMDRSIANHRQPVPLPLAIDLDEEARFNQSFETQFGCHPHDIERAIQVSFKAR
jgi:predicted dehydrogenase